MRAVEPDGDVDGAIQLKPPWITHSGSAKMATDFSLFLFPLPLPPSPSLSLSLPLSLSFHLTLLLSFSYSCQLSLSLLNDNDNDHRFSRVSLSVLTALTYPVCQSAWALHSLIGELFAPCRNKLSRCTCSDLVPLEKSGPVPVLEMEMCLCCRLWCRVCLLSVSVSVRGVVWCGRCRRCGVACQLLFSGLSSMRCLLYYDIHTRRENIIWLPLRGSCLLLPFVSAFLNFSPR